MWRQHDIEVVPVKQTIHNREKGQRRDIYAPLNPNIVRHFVRDVE